jgi:hypothetical protein
MIGLTLLATTAFTLAALAILCAVATRDSALMPATVNPFGPTRVSDPSADTLPNDCHAAATLAGDWQSQEFKTLCEVEDMLDWLENHDVRQTELQNLGGKFVVRWR